CCSRSRTPGSACAIRAQTESACPIREPASTGCTERPRRWCWKTRSRAAPAHGSACHTGPLPRSTRMPAEDRVRALIVDDEPLARDCVRIALRDEPLLEVVGECEDGASAVQAIRTLRPDVVFLDVQMPEMDGL